MWEIGKCEKFFGEESWNGDMRGGDAPSLFETQVLAQKNII
jgi:hypothetical protein